MLLEDVEYLFKHLHNMHNVNPRLYQIRKRMFQIEIYT